MNTVPKQGSSAWLRQDCHKNVQRRREMATFTLTLVRHGETNENRQRIIQGQLNTSLSPKGEQQAQLAGQRLQNERFSLVFSSDLQRAYQTCQLLLQYNKATTSRAKLDARLRERRYGEYEGRHRSEFHRAVTGTGQKYADFVPSGGESLHQVRQRAVLFFQELCQKVKQEAEGNTNHEGTYPKRRRHTGSTCSTTSDVFTSNEGPGIEGQGHVINQNNPEGQTSDHSNSGSTSGCSSLTDSTDTSNSNTVDTNITVSSIDSPVPLKNGLDSEDRPTFYLESSDQVTSQEIPVYAGCPNVSLSPISQRQMSRISSISSGRNSFDEEINLLSMADVLVVSHGEFIKEMITYFMDELQCRVPGGRQAVQHHSPNTGISKFTVSLDDIDGQVTVTCLYLYDQDHLLGLGVEALCKGGEA